MVNSTVRYPRLQGSSAMMSRTFSHERSSKVPSIDVHRQGGHSRTTESHSYERRGPQSQKYSISSQREGGEDELVCDYDQNVTTLYELLESSQWDQTRLQCRTHPEEAQTWIVRRDEHHRVKWKLLPLHAAVIFQAPLAVIESLFQEYPEAAQSRDDQGMLPLHLAFRHSTDDLLLIYMLQKHPDAALVRDNRNRLPLDHAGDRSFSCDFLKLFSQACMNTTQARSVTLGSPDNSAVRAHFEKEIEALHHQYEENLANIQLRQEEEKELMRVNHEEEMKKMKEVAGQHSVNNNGGAYHHLKDALRRITADNQTLRTLLQEEKSQYDKLQAQMKMILHDQTTLETYCEKQRKEMEHAQRLHDDIMKAFSAQNEISSTSQQISKLSESIRFRTEALMLRPERIPSPKMTTGLSSPRQRSMTESFRYTQNADRLGASAREADNGNGGDDISAITDDNNYRRY